MATDLVTYNGLYLSGRVRDLTIPCFQTYISIVVPDILSKFRGLEERAEKVSEAEYERLGARPASEDFEGDMSEVAEAAFDARIAFYQLMTDFRQATVNLLAVGLFHLLEQQLAYLTTDGLFRGLTPLKDANLAKVRAWYKDELDLDLADFEQWPTIDGELRRVANTVKHAEGASARDLRAMRPEHFENPILVGHLEMSEWMKKGPQIPVHGPLTGDGFYLSDDALQEYGEVVLAFIDELASKFAELGRNALTRTG